MFEEIVINYFHPVLNIGLEHVKSAWLLSTPPVKFKTSIHRGSLVYRIPGSGKRISYRSIKKGLIKKRIVLRLPLTLLPF